MATATLPLLGFPINNVKLIRKKAKSLKFTEEHVHALVSSEPDRQETLPSPSSEPQHGETWTPEFRASVLELLRIHKLKKGQYYTLLGFESEHEIHRNGTTETHPGVDWPHNNVEGLWKDAVDCALYNRLSIIEPDGKDAGLSQDRLTFYRDIRRKAQWLLQLAAFALKKYGWDQDQESFDWNKEEPQPDPDTEWDDRGNLPPIKKENSEKAKAILSWLDGPIKIFFEIEGFPSVQQRISLLIALTAVARALRGERPFPAQVIYLTLREMKGIPNASPEESEVIAKKQASTFKHYTEILKLPTSWIPTSAFYQDTNEVDMEDVRSGGGIDVNSDSAREVTKTKSVSTKKKLIGFEKSTPGSLPKGVSLPKLRNQSFSQTNILFTGLGLVIGVRSAGGSIRKELTNGTYIDRDRRGYRVFVNSGSMEHPIYRVFAGAEFGRGAGSEFRKLAPGADESNDPDLYKVLTRTDIEEVIGYMPVESRYIPNPSTNDSRRRGVAFFYVKWNKSSIRTRWSAKIVSKEIITRSLLESIAGRSIVKSYEQTCEYNNQQKRKYIKKMLAKGYHPDTHEKMRSRDYDSLPWLSAGKELQPETVHHNRLAKTRKLYSKSKVDSESDSESESDDSAKDSEDDDDSETSDTPVTDDDEQGIDSVIDDDEQGIDSVTSDEGMFVRGKAKTQSKKRAKEVERKIIPDKQSARQNNIGDQKQGKLMKKQIAKVRSRR